MFLNNNNLQSRMENGQARSPGLNCSSTSTVSNESTGLLSVRQQDNGISPNKFKSKSCENLSSLMPVPGIDFDLSKALSNSSRDISRAFHQVTHAFSNKPTTISKSTNQYLYTEENRTRSLPKSVEKNVYPDSSDVSIKVVDDQGDLEQEGWMRFLGIFLALAAALQFSMSALIIKVLGYHPFNLGVWRFAVMACIPIPFLVHATVWKQQRFFEDIWPIRSVKTTVFIMLQAIVGGNSIIFLFFGLKYINIADCITISTSAPVFVTLVAFMFLGERCGLFPVVTALLALIGVGIISKPPILTGAETLNHDSMIGVASSFTSMMLLTICYVLLRYLRKVHHALVNLCFGLWGFFQSLIMATTMDVLEMPKSYHEAGLIMLSALLAFSGQTCVTLALKYEQAGPVALVRTSEVVFAFGWQAVFLGVKPDLYSVVGAFVTLSGVVLTALRKTIISLPEDHKYKRWFCFLLY